MWLVHNLEPVRRIGQVSGAKPCNAAPKEWLRPNRHLGRYCTKSTLCYHQIRKYKQIATQYHDNIVTPWHSNVGCNAKRLQCFPAVVVSDPGPVQSVPLEAPLRSIMLHAAWYNDTRNLAPSAPRRWSIETLQMAPDFRRSQILKVKHKKFRKQ